MNGARLGGICADGYALMRSYDRDSLIDYYIKNPDWCLERNFPTLPVFREHFSDIEHKGIFVGKKFHGELLNDLQVYIFHNCKGTIKVGLNVDKAILPMLYLANGCRLRIVGTGVCAKKPSEIPVYTFGKNDVSARDNKFVRFKRYENDIIAND